MKPYDVEAAKAEIAAITEREAKHAAQRIADAGLEAMHKLEV